MEKFTTPALAKQAKSVAAALLWFTALVLMALTGHAQPAVRVKPQSRAVTFQQALQQRQAEESRAQNLSAAKRTWAKTQDQEGNAIELQGIDALGFPNFLTTHNIYAARTSNIHHLYSGGGLGLSLSGTGYTLLEWDQGMARPTHVELTGRVTNGDGAGNASHSTHVAGTMMASGVNATAKGAAAGATLKCYDWTNDLVEMDAEATTGKLVANQSYGHVAGWLAGSPWRWYGRDADFEDVRFGYYNSSAAAHDAIAADHKYFTIVKAAGNNRSGGTINGPGVGVPYHIFDPNTGTWVFSTAARSPNTGYDILPSWSVSKNILTVGAIDKNTSYTGPASVLMSSYSSWGPTDDGRIKPDLVAHGTGVFSSDVSNDTHYSLKSGTSMAAPIASSAVILLQEHFHNLYGTHMTSAQVKSLLIHTTDEAGPHDGPDYKFGWGKLNASTAAKVVSNDGAQHLISLFTLQSGQSIRFYVRARADVPLTGTLAWIDPAFTPINPVAVDDSTITLINDVDMRIKKVGTGTEYKPSCMNLAFPDNAAYPGDNIRDNVERIVVTTPDADALYEVVINHKGTLTGGSQEVALTMSGLTPTSLWNGSTGALATASLWAWGGVPTASSTISVVSGRLDVNANLTVEDVLIGAAGRLNVASGTTISVSGHWANEGILTANALTLRAAGSTSTTFWGTTTCQNWVLQSPNVYVNRATTGSLSTHSVTAPSMPVAQTIAPTALVKLVRKDGYNGYIGTMPAGSSISGNYEVAVGPASNTPAWHFLGAPVAGMTLANWNTYLSMRGTYPGAQAGATNLYFYQPNDPTNYGWVEPTNITNATPLGTAVRVYLHNGFFSSQAGTFKFTGTPPVNDVTVNLNYCTSGCATWTGQGPTNGFNLVSVPLGVYDAHLTSRMHAPDHLTAWNKNVYGSYSIGSGVGTNGVGRYLPAGQGIFVEATAAGASITFPEAAKVTTPAALLRMPVVAAIRLHATDAQGNEDELALPLRPDGGTQYDGHLDARKMLNPALNLAVAHTAGLLSIKAMKADAPVAFPLLLKGNGLVQFRAEGLQDLPAGWQAVIKHNATGAEMVLEGGRSIQLEATTGSTATYTFMLRQSPVLSVNGVQHLALMLMPNPAQATVRLAGLYADAQVGITNAAGVLVQQNQVSGSDPVLDVQGLPAGVYTVRVSTPGQCQMLKLVKE